MRKQWTFLTSFYVNIVQFIFTDRCNFSIPSNNQDPLYTAHIDHSDRPQ